MNIMTAQTRLQIFSGAGLIVSKSVPNDMHAFHMDRSRRHADDAQSALMSGDHVKAEHHLNKATEHLNKAKKARLEMSARRPQSPADYHMKEVRRLAGTHLDYPASPHSAEHHKAQADHHKSAAEKHPYGSIGHKQNMIEHHWHMAMHHMKAK